jgi:hypothetical protein
VKLSGIAFVDYIRTFESRCGNHTRGLVRSIFSSRTNKILVKLLLASNTSAFELFPNPRITCTIVKKHFPQRNLAAVRLNLVAHIATPRLIRHKERQKKKSAAATAVNSACTVIPVASQTTLLMIWLSSSQDLGITVFLVLLFSLVSNGFYS